MSKKVFIKTFGCQMNEYDSQKMRDLLGSTLGYVATEQELDADLLVLNTCSVREKAQEKVFSQLGRWRELKKHRPHLMIAVGGCVASQEGEAIVKRASYVDVVFGPQTLHRLPQLINDAEKTRRPAIDIRFPAIEKFDHFPVPGVQGPTAYVSVMEGCSKYCTFCVVPFTRGEEVSRPLDHVLTEVAQLVELGVKEITLLGQNVNAYRGTLVDGGDADLALLIDHLAAISEIKRIRYTTSHPVEVTDRLIAAHAEHPKLVAHLHLPVQSGSDRILKLMKRGYTVAEYKAKIEHLRAVRPDISVSSDFIVGFPGETEEDFASTLALVDDIGFDHSYSFIYSARPGTVAADFADGTTPDEKSARLGRLQQHLNQHGQRLSRQMLNTDQPILVEGQSRRNPDELTGRTENNRRVYFTGSRGLVGQVVKVRILALFTNSLRGKCVESESTATPASAAQS